MKLQHYSKILILNLVLLILLPLTPTQESVVRFEATAQEQNPVLFLHGWKSTHWDWFFIQERLANDEWLNTSLYANDFADFWPLGVGEGSTVTYEWMKIDQPCCPPTSYPVNGSSVDVAKNGWTPGYIMSAEIKQINESEIFFTRTFTEQEDNADITTDLLSISRASTNIDIIGAHFAHPLITTNTTLLEITLTQEITFTANNFTFDDRNSIRGWSFVNTYEIETDLLIKILDVISL